MSKQRRIKGEGSGTPLTVWVSETTKNAIDQEADRLHLKRSTVARRVLESKFNPKETSRT